MCDWCEPTYGGYVRWEGKTGSAFSYTVAPSERQIYWLEHFLGGLPLELNIPYV